MKMPWGIKTDININNVKQEALEAISEATLHVNESDTCL